VKIAAAIGFLLFVAGLLTLFGGTDALLTKLELKDEAGELIGMILSWGNDARTWLFSR
jgi:hypothetical protein